MLGYPEQNLDRCRTQFKLVQDMENQFAQMQAVVACYILVENNKIPHCMT